MMSNSDLIYAKIVLWMFNFMGLSPREHFVIFVLDYYWRKYIYIFYFAIWKNIRHNLFIPNGFFTRRKISLGENFNKNIRKTGGNYPDFFFNTKRRDQFFGKRLRLVAKGRPWWTAAVARVFYSWETFSNAIWVKCPENFM